MASAADQARTRSPSGLEGHTENLLWQVLAGTWTDDGPIELDRLTRYLIKAAREQKLWTSWTNPDNAAEDALVGHHHRAVRRRGPDGSLRRLVRVHP